MFIFKLGGGNMSLALISIYSLVEVHEDWGYN